MSDMFDSLQDEMAGLRRELEAVKAERDWALRELSEWRERHDALFDEALRLKARWQAELMKQARRVRNYSNPHDVFEAIPVAALEGELLRQAEEAK